MIRAVLDEVVPADFLTFFDDSDIDVTAFPDEWRSLPDGAVLTFAAATGYDWLVTCDKRMPFQQNLRGSRIAVLVLPTPRILELEQIGPALRAALRVPAPGHFVLLDAHGQPKGAPVSHLTGRVRRGRT